MKNTLSKFTENQLSREQMKKVVGGDSIYNIWCVYKGSNEYTLIAQSKNKKNAYHAGNTIYKQGGYSSCLYTTA